MTSFLSSTSQAQVAFYNKLMANALIEFLFPIIFYSKSLQLCSFLIPPPLLPKNTLYLADSPTPRNMGKIELEDQSSI